MRLTLTSIEGEVIVVEQKDMGNRETKKKAERFKKKKLT